MRTVRCAGCRADIFWKYTQKGAQMPLDAEPTKESGQGVYVLDGREHVRQYEPLFDTDVVRYMNHWSTCTAAGMFRSKGDRA